MVRAYVHDQIALSVRDQLRDVEFRMRRKARRALFGSPEGEVALLPQQVVIVADAIFSQLQSAATAVLIDRESRNDNFVFPAPIFAYFDPKAIETHTCTPRMYYALKGLLRRFGARHCLVSERAVEEFFDWMRTRHRALIASCLSGESHDLIRLCAALTVELAASQPVLSVIWKSRFSTSAKSLIVSPNHYVAFVIGLSIAITSRSWESNDDQIQSAGDILDSVELAVSARFEELSGALKQRDPIDRLTTAFSELLPFIP